MRGYICVILVLLWCYRSVIVILTHTHIVAVYHGILSSTMHKWVQIGNPKNGRVLDTGIATLARNWTLVANKCKLFWVADL